MNNNNKVWYWVIAIVAVALIVIFAVRAQKGADLAGDDMANGDDSALVATEDISEGSANLPATSGVAPVTMSYQTALSTYANRRLQFDKNCQATPNTVTYKSNTNIMLDNRSPESRTIRLGGLGNVTVKGYGFKIVNLTTATLPVTLSIDCGASQNVATVLMQK
jgi:hypothetical protein